MATKGAAKKPKATAAKKNAAKKAAEMTAKEVVEEVVVDESAEADLEKPDQAEQASSFCGGALKEAREAQGLTVSDIASQLRLSVNQIEALEADNFTVLPETAIVKGFIRNYAKLLNVPAAPILSAFMQHVPEAQQHELTLKPSVNMKITEHKNHGRYYVAAGLAILIGLAVWFFYQKYIQKPNPVEPATELSGVAPDLPEVALALPAAERVVENEVEQSTTSSDEESSAVSEDQAEAAVDKADADAVDTEAAAETAPAVTDLPVATGKKRVEIKATQETWVSITNAYGREVYSKILFAGNSEVLDVRPPMKIVFGNAHGATLSVDGNDLDLAPYTRVNVARIKVD